jgi:hypothetical protein
MSPAVMKPATLPTRPRMMIWDQRYLIADQDDVAYGTETEDQRRHAAQDERRGSERIEGQHECPGPAGADHDLRHRQALRGPLSPRCCNRA